MSFKPKNFVVWTEIPVRDLDRGIAFYQSVFDLDMTRDQTGPNPVAFFPTDDKDGIAGHLYPGEPVTGGCGPTVHFACPDSLEKTRERITENGGEVVSDTISIPPGSFFYAKDPDGNSIGIFQPTSAAA
ncbi:MAG: VOC family protein [Alphaproteobacteria bacterium]